MRCPLPFFVSLLVGCGGTSSEPVGDAVDPALAAEYCDAIVARDTSCGNPPEADFCDSYRLCIESVFRPELVPELTNCMRNLACDGNDDSCLAPPSRANTSAVFAAFKMACQARLEACDGELSEGFFCFEDELGVATDSVILENHACLDDPCTSIRGCMDVIAYEHHCKG